MLNLPTVLVLNRHWQAIHVKTPAEAFCMMASDAATGLDISDGNFLPTKWSDWVMLPVRDCNQAVNTPRGPVRVPTVIIAVNYARVPLRRPRFGARGVRLRKPPTAPRALPASAFIRNHHGVEDWMHFLR
jgi:hypothetical protein